MKLTIALIVLVFSACLFSTDAKPYRKPIPDCPIFCTYHYDPVCGSDGNTYANKCVLESTACRQYAEQNLYVSSQGECGDSGIICCQAVTATCEACKAGFTVDEYCLQNPNMQGC